MSAALFALAITVFTIGAGVALIVARRLTRPIQRLTTATVELGQGNFAIDIPPSHIPELDRAATALKATARRLDTLVTRERAFSTDASHQLRTPLAGLRANIETELAFPRPDPATVMGEALADIERLETTITELLTIARTEQAFDQDLEVAPVIEAVRQAWHGRFAAAGRPLRVDNPTRLPVAVGNPAMLRNALDVLLDNALVHGAGQVAIQTTVAPTTIVITVSDQGNGFSRGEPMDPTSEPHGMGLALATRLLDAMSARLIISHDGPGPTIDLVLARARVSDRARP